MVCLRVQHQANVGHNTYKVCNSAIRNMHNRPTRTNFASSPLLKRKSTRLLQLIKLAWLCVLQPSVCSGSPAPRLYHCLKASSIEKNIETTSSTILSPYMSKNVSLRHEDPSAASSTLTKVSYNMFGAPISGRCAFDSGLFLNMGRCLGLGSPIERA